MENEVINLFISEGMGDIVEFYMNFIIGVFYSKVVIYVYIIR